MKAKILIVDDEPNLLRMLEYSLQVEGYTIILASNGQEALYKVKREQPDLAILDVMLPDMSGLEICQRLRSSVQTLTLPVIMLSARGQVADKVAGLQAGADEYVTKPVDPNELVARVAALLARTRRLRQTQPAPSGKVIGFIGAKGGTGTTTVALNVAAALANQGKNVVAVELRSSFGAFAAQLGGAPLDNLSELLELEPTALTEEVVSARLAHHPSGLRLLFGPQKVEQFKSILYTQAQAIIKGLSSQAEYTIIDLAHYPAEANWAALQLCSSIALVMEPNLSSLMGAKIMLDLLKAWGVSRGLVGVVVVNQRSSKVNLDELRRQLGCGIIGVIPPAAEVSLAAQAQGIPLVLYQPQNLAAIQLNEVAARLSAAKMMPMQL